jgi:hypothetical protein
MTMRSAALAWLVCAPLVANAANPVWEARYAENAAGKRELAVFAPVAARRLDEQSFPAFIQEHAPLGGGRVVVLRAKDPDTLRALLRARGVDTAAVDGETAGERRGDDELFTLVTSGPAENRIDLVFMGDGYTAVERAKFLADIQRLVRDLFEGPTFRSYLPLFNVHAVFRPSTESGIGRSDRPKDTAYRLSRDGETLRAIFPGNLSAIRASCRAAPGCDYPVVIANDPYYGGLGGEVAISTNSQSSGSIVLRHELGHNFGQIGEEYDGGGYFGANFASSLESIGWTHWLSAPSQAVAAEPVVARFLGWPWHKLSRGPYRVAFTSDGRYEAAAINLSASGIAADEQWRVTLDGEPLGLRAPGHDDRSFYELRLAGGMTAGPHELRVEETGLDSNNWVSSLTVHEFGPGYHFDDDYVGAFPLFEADGSVAGYRSTHGACLMRDMTSPTFCQVCTENNWLQFLAKLRLIDGVEAVEEAGVYRVELAAQRLPGLRVSWHKDGREVEALRDKLQWTLPSAEAGGAWRVDVRFETDEIRKDDDGLTRDTAAFRI